MIKSNLDLILKVIPIFISIISLIISIVVAWKNKKSLQVQIADNLEVIDDGNLGFFDGEDVNTYEHCLIGKIEVVNPSPKDIAFFDLRAFNPENNINFHLMTRKTLFDPYRNKSIWRTIEFPEGKENLTEVSIPDANYGIFKANSFTRFDIVIFPEDSTKNVFLSFKVAMKARKKDPFAVTKRKKFRFFGHSYDTISWTESIQQQQKQEKELK